MPGRRMSPEQSAQALAMRTAGYSMASISKETGLSVRTLSRLFARCQAKPEPIADELVQRARSRLLEAIDSSERVREAVASSMADSLALTRALRDKVALALEVIDVSNHGQAREAARALAQLASAMKATQSVYRSTFGDEEISPAKPTVLEIRDMTAEEISQAQRKANEALGSTAGDPEDEGGDGMA